MGKFLPQDFLLQKPQARELYHDYAGDQPIIDYHSHLPPTEINSNRSFDTVTEYLAGWRP
ncbi:MAG: glucuronate isomerase [Balneolaceae bacterium]|nr:glucuronate isomerase [Balneolaceae bacterium]